MYTGSCAWKIRQIRGEWKTSWEMMEGGARAERALKTEERTEYLRY